MFILENLYLKEQLTVLIFKCLKNASVNSFASVSEILCAAKVHSVN